MKHKDSQGIIGISLPQEPIPPDPPLRPLPSYTEDTDIEMLGAARVIENQFKEGKLIDLLPPDIKIEDLRFKAEGADKYCPSTFTVYFTRTVNVNPDDWAEREAQYQKEVEAYEKNLVEDHDAHKLWEVKVEEVRAAVRELRKKMEWY